MNAPLLRTFHAELVSFFNNPKIAEDENLQMKMGMLHKIMSRSELPENAWLPIKISLSPLVSNEHVEVSQFAEKWVKLIDALAITNFEMTSQGDTIYVLLTNKTHVVVYKNNSALFVRSIVKNKVNISAYINDIFNESESTKILYQAQESNAYDLIHKIQKHVTQYRLANSIIASDEENNN